MYQLDYCDYHWYSRSIDHQTFTAHPPFPQCQFVQLVIDGVRKIIEMEETLERGESIDELVANAGKVKE